MRVPTAQLLQEDLELEQVRVNSLTHMVVVVDENSGDSATAALESKLQVRLQQREAHFTGLHCLFFLFFFTLHFFPRRFSQREAS